MKKLTVKPTHQRAIINYDFDKVKTDTGLFKFDKITFNYNQRNAVQIVTLWLHGEIITELYFDEKDTFKVIYKDNSTICNCNRNLEMLISKYCDILRNDRLY